MSKIYISPNALAAMAKECTNSNQLIKLYELIKIYAHPYQLGWIQEQIYKLQIKEKEQEEIQK